MNKKATTILAMVLTAISACSAPPASKNFEEFRRGMHQRYDSFRQEMLSNYARFLDGEWVEFQWFPADERDDTPKPVVAPVAPGETPPAPADRIGSKPGTPAEAKPSSTPAEPQQDGCFGFDFYGLSMRIPEIDLRIMDRINTTADYAAQWRQLASTRESARLTAAIAEIARRHNFNDYLTFDLARHYAAAKYPGASPASRTSLLHYIMANLGYDARIGTTAEGNAVIMLPCRQTIYGRTYLMFGQEKYYVFTDPATDLGMRRTAISSCRLPEAAGQGRRIDLSFAPLAIPSSPREFHITDGNLSISGTVNQNLFPIIYRYPQMPIGDYARSSLQTDIRDSIVSQLKEQLCHKPLEQAVDELLAFVQKAFTYATDEQAHGFEKPYFLEETLFYPECDCEDRVILYTYLLWHVLGVENHLLAFPGHESAAVCLGDAPRGDSYTYEGKTFLISDPTFIGARTGMCMPSYKSKVPEIDHIYK